MTQLEVATVTLAKVFETYACKEGKTGTLTKNELKTLLENEFPAFIKNCQDPSGLSRLMEALDKDKDREVTFAEYGTFLSALSSVCHRQHAMK